MWTNVGEAKWPSPSRPTGVTHAIRKSTTPAHTGCSGDPRRVAARWSLPDHCDSKKKGSQPSEPPQDLPATHPTDLCPSEALNLSTTEVAPWEEMRCRQATGQEDSEDPKNKLQAHWWDLCRVVGSGVHCEPWHQGNQELPSYTSGLVESGQVGEEPS